MEYQDTSWILTGSVRLYWCDKWRTRDRRRQFVVMDSWTFLGGPIHFLSIMEDIRRQSDIRRREWGGGPSFHLLCVGPTPCLFIHCAYIFIFFSGVAVNFRPALRSGILLLKLHCCVCVCHQMNMCGTWHECHLISTNPYDKTWKNSR